ncbi:MAG TPA: hypothetical protein VF144_05300 [Chitinophagaceae bacterium]
MIDSVSKKFNIECENIEFPGGKRVSVFHLTNGAMDVGILSYGATILSIRVPDRFGVKRNVVAGFKNPLQYLDSHPYLGCTVGELMYQTHRGLREEFDVSCRELDFLVDFVRASPDVIGARMVGGGFGGCTINLVKEDAVENLSEKISKEYEENLKLPLTTYVATIENGASIIERSSKSISENFRINKF